MLTTAASERDTVSLRNVVPPGSTVDDFERDDGWSGDRPATCGNMWEMDRYASNPPYLLGGTWGGVPAGPGSGALPTTLFDSGGYIYLGPGEHSISFDVTNSIDYGDQNYWVVQLLVEGVTAPTAFRNLQLEVCQRNSFVVNYYDGISFPHVYASGAGMPFGATWRWYFTATPVSGGVNFLVERSNVDGTGRTTVMSGTTTTGDHFDPAGSFMYIYGAYQSRYQRVDRLGSNVTVYSNCNVVTDTFNRAAAGDGTLGFTDTGQRWLAVPPVSTGTTGNTWTTQGTTPNKAQMIAAALDMYRVARNMVDTGGNNMDVTYTTSTDDDDYTGCHVRVKPDRTCGYEVITTCYGTCSLVYYTPSGTATLATWSALSLHTTYTIRVRARNTQIQIWINGSLVANVTHSPEDGLGYQQTTWTYFVIQQNHGGSGGSAPRQLIAYAGTWHENLNIAPPTTPGTNLLTPQQWSLDSGTTAGFGNPSTFMSLSADNAFTTLGSYSLKATPSPAAAAGNFTTVPNTPCLPSTRYNVSVMNRRTFGTSNYSLIFQWYDSAGAFITQDDSGDRGPTTSGTWDAGTFSAVSPSNAASVRIMIQTTGIGSIFAYEWFDQLGLYETTTLTPIFIAP